MSAEDVLLESIHMLKTSAKPGVSGQQEALMRGNQVFSQIAQSFFTFCLPLIKGREDGSDFTLCVLREVFKL